MTTILHSGNYKPRLAALSFPRQPSSGCLCLKWKPIWRWKMKKGERRIAQRKQKAARVGTAATSHPCFHVTSAVNWKTATYLRKHSALPLLHVHNKSEHHHHNRIRCWPLATDEGPWPKDVNMCSKAKLNCYLWLGLDPRADWGQRFGLPPA